MPNWEMVYNENTGDLVGHWLDGKFYTPAEFEKLFEDRKK